MKRMKQFIVFLLALGLAASLAGCGETAPARETATPVRIEDAATATEVPATEAPRETDPPADSAGKVATAAEMTTVETVVEDGMTPVYVRSLVPGTYPVEMVSSSSMFKADHCELTVSEAGMAVNLYMTSKSYLYLFPGTAEEAAAAEEADYIPLVPVDDVYGVFTLPIEALDAGVPCAAYSRNKELWYDRSLLFRVDSLPAEAFAEGFFTTAASLGLEDGTYTAEVTLAGGSGKAKIASPALLTVRDGQCAARIEWSSSNYDYMIAGDGARYLPLNSEGNSVFEIPVSVFDRPMTVSADTTAMSQPYEIEYTLTFDSATLAAAAE